MRRATPLLVLLAFSSSCATGAVRLERYRGAYSTHFEGIPDQAEICAVLRNRSARPVEASRVVHDSMFATLGHPLVGRNTVDGPRGPTSRQLKDHSK